jgi:proliferating cell nuclear antigen
MVCVFELKTTLTVHIRTLFDSLNPLLTDINIHFYPNVIKGVSSDEDKVGGVIIKEVNKTSSILIHCKLDADKFDSYYYNYKNDKLTIGINLSNFLKCIKCMTNCDTMTWRIDDDDINKLIMILESSNEKKTFKINLMDLEDTDYEIEPVKFPYQIIMPTQDFQNYCKNMCSATDKMDLRCLANSLFMSGTGELGVIEFELTATNVSSGLVIKKNSTNSNEIVQGTFELKYLIIFTRCSNLCSHVSLFLKNTYPIIIEYQVAILGKIKFALSPCKKMD